MSLKNECRYKYIDSPITSHSGTEGTPFAKTLSVDYFVNNIISPVRFKDAVKENAVVVEVAPHGILQPILKRSLGSNSTYLSLQSLKETDNALHFSKALGTLFNSGLNINMAALYPPIQFPVSSQALSISPLIQWNHANSHYVAQWDKVMLLGKKVYSIGKDVSCRM
jgi:fatty acid synthase, animal type